MTGIMDGGTPVADPRTVTSDDVQRARLRLAGRIAQTPVLRSDELDRLAGARVWMKAENLQRGGSFKIRGALLAVERIAASGSSGVVAQSTGNHAIAVALAAQEYNLPAVLVLPRDCAAAKIARIRAAGAELVLVGTTLAERMATAEELRTLRGLEIIDPYQDPDVVAGQGTATAELISQVHALGGQLDTVVLPVGGGSAVAGACLAAAGEPIAVVAAEPLAVPALSQALRAGRPVTVPVRSTIADGLRPDRIGSLPFELARSVVSDVLTIEEDEIASALCLALIHARLLIEPAAATALAAALRYARESGGRVHDIGVVLTGGNVDVRLISSLLAETVTRDLATAT